MAGQILILTPLLALIESVLSEKKILCYNQLLLC